MRNNEAVSFLAMVLIIGGGGAESVSLGKGIKSKNKQMVLYQTKKLLNSEGKCQQNKKAIY